MNEQNKTGSSGSPKPVSVLFVCLGNICRSTMAEGVFTHITRPQKGTPHPLIANIDSCGTGAYHVGDGPDSRTMATLEDKGITSYRHRARKFKTSDFQNFDYILAMDDDNYEDLLQLRRREVKRAGGEDAVGKVFLFGDFGGKKRRSGKGEEIQDPYYGGTEGFTIAYEQAVKFSKAFLEQLEAGELS
ncbi:low molecular weight phosphotyrosine protein phosphatase-like protein [Corynespora cassiicola Philippines]|uniref:Low molecular weight phosphotyrosine protein phosphatase-like protein n=1 Tax=Corynespora cassiicola Philippines TaxID=1448308 RepID=A0A2T2P375_CORCC|nr:low molecular weight phosphotyrosine protein phosphatase-like protein [Corynespora cassiicola Philippines]